MSSVSFFLDSISASKHIDEKYSLDNFYWSDEKSRLSEETIEAIMRIKVNMEETCVEFYERLLADKKLLKDIHSSAKYN